MTTMMITREQLENVVPKKKVSEVYHWLKDHFITSSHADYINRCPILIIQGPTGCGKTTTLRCVAKELDICIKEYSETTDLTSVSNEIVQVQDEDERSNPSHGIDRRKASRFEKTVENFMRYNCPLYGNEKPLPKDDSEFDDEDEEYFPVPQSTLGSNLIIHVETPLTFAKSHRLLVQTITRVIKLVRILAQYNKQRVAIVFENMDCDRDVISLPNKFRNSLGVQTIKFNPITKTNMKRFIESLMKREHNIIIDKNTMELIISDCDGDIRACINTIELLRNSSSKNYNPVYNNLDDEHMPRSNGTQKENKKQRLESGWSQVKFNPTLMRDVTRSVGFFHILGKIFYQKRLYPDRPVPFNKYPKPIERPYQTENSTEYLVNSLDIGPSDLMAWLHQHYNKFCYSNNIDRAAMFLEHLSDIDNLSVVNATQSSQFFESRNYLDLLQLHLTIEATTFSLYDDKRRCDKSSHKRITTNRGPYLLKSSVEAITDGGSDLYSFNRPTSMGLFKVEQDYQNLLSYLTNELMKGDTIHRDQSKMLVEYIPYLNHLSNVYMDHASTIKSSLNGDTHSLMSILSGDTNQKVLKTLDSVYTISENGKLDFDTRHECLLELLEETEDKLSAKGKMKKEIIPN